MGNKSLVPPPIDYRVERSMKTFRIPEEKIEVLWAIFLRYDRQKKGMVTMQDFFEFIIKYKPSPLTDSMLGLIEAKSDGTINFGEFVELICTFCSFEQPELLRYFFYILDSGRSGYVKKDELKHMLRTIWDHDIPGSVREAFDYLDRKDDSFGVYNFNEIMLLKNKFPSIFQPVYALQTSIIHNTLGEYWWDMHKVTSYEAKQEEAERAAAIMLKEQRDKERADEMLNEAMIKRRMGIRYYLMPWERAKEMRKLQRIAAIEREFNPG